LLLCSFSSSCPRACHPLAFSSASNTPFCLLSLGTARRVHKRLARRQRVGIVEERVKREEKRAEQRVEKRREESREERRGERSRKRAEKQTSLRREESRPRR
jgi:hypothetical protein